MRSRKARGREPAGLISPETAEAYLEAGRLDEALPMLERTLTYYLQNFGPRDPDTTTVRVYLGAAYQQSGRLHDAIAQFEAALADT